MRGFRDEVSGSSETPPEAHLGTGKGFVDFEFDMSYSRTEQEEVDKLVRQVQNLYSLPGNKRKVSAYVHENLVGDLDLVKAFAKSQAQKYEQDIENFRS